MNDTTVLIELRDCAIGWERPLVPPVTITVREDDYLLIAGPNGAGKTTLIKTMLGMIPPLSGEVRYPAGRPRVGYVPQRNMVPEHYPVTAYDVVLMGRSLMGSIFVSPTSIDRAAAERAMGELGISALAGMRFGELSGGQKQRVLVARALAMDPQMLVLDEPTAGMDGESSATFVTLLNELRSSRRLAVVVVSHELALFSPHAGTICRIDKERNFFTGGGKP